MSDEMRKISMPSDRMVEKGMTPEQREQRQRELADWRAEEKKS